MKYFLDTEFHEPEPGNIKLISIGIVSERNRELYCINSDMDLKTLVEHPWLFENVIKALPPKDDRDHRWINLHTIKFFLDDYFADDNNPEIWAYCGAYDWVVFGSIYNGMMNLPAKFGYCHRELSQLADGLILPGQHSQKHVAINDARWIKEVHGFLTEQK